MLLIVNLDSESGAAIQQKAADAGVKTIDYDRLTLGGPPTCTCRSTTWPSATHRAKASIKCLADKGVERPTIVELNGSPTDNNATLFKQGYHGQPIARQRCSRPSTTEAVPDWDNQKAARSSSRCSPRPAARSTACSSPTTASRYAVIAVLKPNNLQVPVTGQDATSKVCATSCTGDQCMTVYKAVNEEADAAAAAAVALLSGTEPRHGRHRSGHRERPAGALRPGDVQPIFTDDVKTRSTTASSTSTRSAPGARRRVRREAGITDAEALGARSCRDHRPGARRGRAGRPVEPLGPAERVQDAAVQ